MGTQQILLIVLSVIIVGVAIAVGITMFRNQAYNSNQTALASEAQGYAVQVIEYYKKPESLAGAGQLAANVTQAKVATAIGFDPTTFNVTTDNGTFTVTAAADGSTVTITGIGKEVRNDAYPKVTTTITLSTGDIAAVTGTQAVGS